jgi:hypothetical protein
VRIRTLVIGTGTVLVLLAATAAPGKTGPRYADPNECEDNGNNCTDAQLCEFWGENCGSFPGGIPATGAPAEGPSTAPSRIAST